MRQLCDLALWAKLDDATPLVYPVAAHLLDTVASAGVLWDLWLRPGLRTLLTDSLGGGDKAVARAKYCAVAGLHDVGKITSVFQAQSLASKWTASRMSTAGRKSVVDVRSHLAASGYPLEPSDPKNYKPLSAADEAGPVMTVRRHEAASLFALTGVWPNRDTLVAPLWAGAVAGGHHGRFHPISDHFYDAFPQQIGVRLIDQISPAFTFLCSGPWGDQQEAHIEAVLAAAGITRAQMNEPPTSAPGVAVILLTGLVTLADWLASEDTAVSAGRQLNPKTILDDPGDWVARREVWFAERLEHTVGIYRPMADPTASVMGEHADTMTDLQKAALGVGRGLWIAVVPTGDGKTEASLLRHAADPREGLLYALPTRATTDAMWERIRAAFSSTDNAASLAHAHAVLNDFYAPSTAGTIIEHSRGLYAQQWLTGKGRALLAPLTVSTCDQILLASLRQRRAPLRLLAVANRHIVLDEVHTYDPYQAELLKELLAWWGATDTRVTLLSASLPKQRLQDFVAAYTSGGAATVAYPAAVTARAGAATTVDIRSRREYAVDYRITWTAEDKLVETHTDLAMAYYASAPGKRVGVFCNTIDKAVEVSRRLRASGANVITLHSRMTAGHRKHVGQQIETIVGKDAAGSAGVIIVGTQTIEASLDIDFDHAVTDLAPAPSLIQRSGRLWRHSAVDAGTWKHVRANRTGNPIVDVIVAVAEDGTLSFGSTVPYLPAEQKRTLGALLDLPDGRLNVPGDVQAFVDASAFTSGAPHTDERARVSLSDEDEEILEFQRKKATASEVTIPIHHERGSQKSVLASGLTFSVLSRVTAPSEFEESATRFRDNPSQTYVLVDPTGECEWAWHGDVETLRRARNVNNMGAGGNAADQNTAAESQRQLNDILAACVPVSRAAMSRLTGVEIPIEAADWEPQASILRGVVPMVLTDAAAYDDTFGLA